MYAICWHNTCQQILKIVTSFCIKKREWINGGNPIFHIDFVTISIINVSPIVCCHRMILSLYLKAQIHNPRWRTGVSLFYCHLSPLLWSSSTDVFVLDKHSCCLNFLPAPSSVCLEGFGVCEDLSSLLCEVRCLLAFRCSKYFYNVNSATLI